MIVFISFLCFFICCSLIFSRTYTICVFDPQKLWAYVKREREREREIQKTTCSFTCVSIWLVVLVYNMCILLSISGCERGPVWVLATSPTYLKVPTCRYKAGGHVRILAPLLSKPVWQIARHHAECFLAGKHESSESTPKLDDLRWSPRCLCAYMHLRARVYLPVCLLV